MGKLLNSYKETIEFLQGKIKELHMGNGFGKMGNGFKVGNGQKVGNEVKKAKSSRKKR
jgi:hypothetical protein